MRRPSSALRPAWCLIGCLVVLGAPSARGQAADAPFLWRIDVPKPSYLFGTIHVPDARVLALPAVVQRAFDAADVFNAEIPIDDQTEEKALALATLPAGQTLQSLVGDAAFARFVNLIPKFLPAGLPPMAAQGMLPLLQSLKPWAATQQLGILQFLPDLMAGREPLDATLYALAVKNSKTVGGLETVEEQIGVFEGFTRDEQIKIFLDDLDSAEREDIRTVGQTLIRLYLAGDLDGVAGEMKRQSSSGDPALRARLMTRMLDDRNQHMADRIAARLAASPGRSHFFAVGAAHYVGENGLVSLLTKKGFRITRLKASDAASIVATRAA